MYGSRRHCLSSSSSACRISIKCGEGNIYRTSTCSVVQLSILNDLTFEICVPSLRCSEAHRIHKKIPSCRQSHQSSCSTVGILADGSAMAHLHSSLPILVLGKK